MPGTLSPTITVDSITNAVWDQNGNQISSGSVSWSVAAEGGPINASYANYISSYNPNYAWGSTSGTETFDAGQSSVTIQATLSYTIYRVIVSGKDQLGAYNTADEASAAVENLNSGWNAGYSFYYGYEAGGSAYYVYKYNLKQDGPDSGGTYTFSKTVDVSKNTTTQEVTEPDPEPETPSVTHFSVYPPSMTLEVGKTGTVSYLIDVEPPNSNPSYTITSSSSNSSIASCSENVITANSIGTATITFECAGFTDTCVVTVVEATEPDEPDEPDEPNDPIFSLSLVSTTMVTASVTNIKQASVTLQVLNASGNEVSSKTMDFNNKVYATISITTDGLTPNTFYTARVLVDGVSIGTENFTTKKEQESVKIYDIIVDYTSVDIYLEDCPSSSSVSGVMTHDGDIIRGTITFLDDDMCCISFTSLHPGVTSVVDIVVGSASTQITVTTLSYPMFKWTTLIGKGMEMNMYDSNPAPVTADEWNRLLDLIELKLGKSIPYVSQGDKMIAGEGGNIRAVADALGVSVDSGWTITAQFFLDLQDAINNK